MADTANNNPNPNANLCAAYLELVRMLQVHVELERKYLGDYALVTPLVREAPANSGQASKVGAAQIPPAATAAEPPTGSTATNALPVSVPADTPERQNKLAEIAASAACCTHCKLAETRTQVVFGSGAIDARLVLVGEAPGANEDKQGLPFVGEAGKLLTKMLEAIGLKREEVYICNVIKCRPPANREPAPDEILACRPWLTQQLELLHPKLLCALGRFASQALTGVSLGMGEYRGRLYQYQNIPVLCTYHPAHLLYHPEEKKNAWLDLKKVRQFLETGKLD